MDIYPSSEIYSFVYLLSFDDDNSLFLNWKRWEAFETFGLTPFCTRNFAWLLWGVIKTFLKMYELLSHDAGKDTLMGRSSKPKMSAGIMVLEPDSQKCLEKVINDRIKFYEQLRNHG